MAENKRPLGLTLFAVLVGVSALSHFALLSSSSDELVRILSVAVAVSGLAAAIGLWRRDTWALTAFVLWALTVLARQVAREWRVEQVIWEEILAGVVLQVAVLGVCFAFVRSQLRDSRRGDSR